MKNGLFFLFIIFVITSCKKPNDEVQLFNGSSFRLSPFEKVVPITPFLKDAFFLHFDEQAPQIPIYRCIEGDSYKIFIAVPYNTSIEELIKMKLLCEQDSLVQETDFTSYSFRKYECSSKYVSEYTSKVNNNLIYILTETSLESVSDSLFTFDNIKNRFIIK